ncbi:UV excision repair protein RAD23 homolog B-like isoform X2 [Sycon ciliatum]|uniref:UV excision repair protein RAD23 homolog B-like isoform X2 n=1 Tax=Sycon ciliatum TaxID=27933 RepID=UPI0020AB6717
MKVTLKTLKQQTFSIELEEGWKVKDLKNKIADLKGDEFPVDGQKLIFSGKILHDDSSLSEYTFTDTSFIVIMCSKPRQPAKAAAAPAAQPDSVPEQARAALRAAGIEESGMTAQVPLVSGQSSTGDSSRQPEAEGSSSTPAPASTQPASTPAAETSTTATTSSDGGSSQPPAAEDPAGTVDAEFDGMVAQLCQMGFEASQVRLALRASFNNPDRAVEYLMTGIPESVKTDLGLNAPAAPATTAPPSSGGAPMDTSAGTSSSSTSQPTPASGAGNALAALRTMPQFDQVRNVIRQNPQMLPALLQQIGSQNPGLLELISHNQQDFIDMMNEPDLNFPAEQGGTAGQPAGGSAPTIGGQPVMPGGEGSNVMYVTAEEKEAIERLKALGFAEYKVVEAYFACDKNEDLAANFLLQQAYDD